MPARHPTADPTAARAPAIDPTRTAGPPAPDALDNATTNPPPFRRGPSGPPAMPIDPAQIAAALSAIVSRVSAAPFGMPHSPSMPAHDAGATEPSMPALDVGDDRSVDLSPAPPSSPSREGAPGGSTGLAGRVDALLASDEWGSETPVVAPSSAELRVLFGQPDVTRQLPVAEVELLQRHAAELADGDRRRRPPPGTAEVDPDDIEAAIELAPPARRPVARNTIGVTRPKKSE